MVKILLAEELTLDDVRVNYNSAKPAKRDVPDCPQGDRVGIGSGQEHYGPHKPGTERRTKFIQRMVHNAVIQMGKAKTQKTRVL